MWAGAIPLFGSLRCTLVNGAEQCEAGIHSALQPISALHESELSCWSACVEMAFRYHGYAVSQVKIAEEAWGAGPSPSGSPSQMLAKLNRDWSDGSKRFRAQVETRSVKPLAIAEDLDQDSPLIVGFVDREAGHYPVLLTSLVFRRTKNGTGRFVSATVNDPWPGRGRRTLSERELISINLAARIRVGDYAEKLAGEPASRPRAGHWEVVPCQHWLHPEGDLVACTHVCGTFGDKQIMCHVKDRVPCTHPLHDAGDEVWVPAVSE